MNTPPGACAGGGFAQGDYFRCRTERRRGTSRRGQRGQQRAAELAFIRPISLGFRRPRLGVQHASGWEGGHIYDTQGTYTVHLDVTDGNGNTNSTTTTINVLADARKVVYVDASAGNDANVGSITSPIRSFAKATKLATSNVKFLFHRGQKWDTTTWLSVTGQNVYIGAYGDGANPILNVTAGVCAIQTFGSSNHTVIEGLTFDSQSHAAKGTLRSSSASANLPGARTSAFAAAPS